MMTSRAVSSLGTPLEAVSRSSTDIQLRSILRRAAVLPISLYGTIISPILFNHFGPACRFEPPCSAYAREAILRHGLPQGVLLALRRVIRCRPGGGFGFDPVPCERRAGA